MSERRTGAVTGLVAHGGRDLSGLRRHHVSAASVMMQQINAERWFHQEMQRLADAGHELHGDTVIMKEQPSD